MSSKMDVDENVGNEPLDESDVQAGESSASKRRRLNEDGSHENYVNAKNTAAKTDHFIFKREIEYHQLLSGTEAYSFDGRFFFNHDKQFVEVVDVLYKKQRKFKFDFSAVTYDGKPLKEDFHVLDYCAFNLETALIVFESETMRYCVGIGVTNFEQSTVVIGQSIKISGLPLNSNIHVFPKSYPANLEDGVVLNIFVVFGSLYFEIKLDGQKQIQATKLDFLFNKKIATIDGEFAYNLDVKRTDDKDEDKREISSVELLKMSFGTGESSRYPTTNWEAIKLGHFYSFHGRRFGNHIIFPVANRWTDEVQLMSLNLDTLEWKETGIKLNGYIEKMSTDGEGGLMICMSRINKPYSLSTCAWHKLTSLSDTRQDAYDFILSKLPTNFRPPRPIEHSVPLYSAP